jgi:hypothetical protein
MSIHLHIVYTLFHSSFFTVTPTRCLHVGCVAGAEAVSLLYCITLPSPAAPLRGEHKPECSPVHVLWTWTHGTRLLALRTPDDLCGSTLVYAILRVRS